MGNECADRLCAGMWQRGTWRKGDGWGRSLCTQLPALHLRKPAVSTERPVEPAALHVPGPAQLRAAGRLPA